MKYLITGGTGTFGQAMTKRLLARGHSVKVISRDEQKQYAMKFDIPDAEYQLCDIRNREATIRAAKGCDYIIHAAAMKIVTEGETNPDEFIRTNIIGTQNVIAAAEQNDCRLFALSTDKAVSPVNLYGATKMILEKLILVAGYGVCRYGNVVGSRGSVVPAFLEQRKQGFFIITHPEMTRFWLPLEHALDFVEVCMNRPSALPYVETPKMPSVRVVDIAAAIDPDLPLKVTGVRPGEKLHEEIEPGISSGDNEFLTVEQIRESLHANKFL